MGKNSPASSKAADLIDFSAQIVGPDGRPAVEPEGFNAQGLPLTNEDGSLKLVPITLRSVCYSALTRDGSQHGNVPAPTPRLEETLRLAKLAHKVATAAEPIDLTVAEKNTIVERLARFPAEIVYGAMTVLDPARLAKA